MGTTTKRIIAVGTPLAAIAASGIAFAAWTASGTGSGAAKAKSAQLLSTVSATADTSAQLYPTGSGDLQVRVTNPNDYDVTVTSITQTPSSSITSGDTTCDAMNGVTFDGATGLTEVVPAGSLGTLITLPDSVHMSNDSVDACQGKTFSVPVTIGGASS
jgi:hypothetical protein